MTGLAAGLLYAASLAVGNVLIRDVAKRLDPVALNAPRMVVAALASIAIAAATGRMTGYRTVTCCKLALLLGSMLLGRGLGDCLYTASLARIGVSTSYPIANSSPALTMVFSMLFLGESISVSLAVGLALVVVGIILIGRCNETRLSEARPQRTLPGVTLALIAAVCWAGAVTLTVPGIEGLDPVMVTLFRVPAVAVALGGLTLAKGTWRQLLSLSAKDWIAIVLAGLVGGGLGSILFLVAVSLVGAARTSVLTATSPLFALVLSVAFLKERATWSVLVGTVLTVGGIVLVS